MINKNTTFNLPVPLVAAAKAYAASHKTSVTAIIREHLERVTGWSEDMRNEQESSALEKYSKGLIDSREAIAAIGVRDYADLLVALGDVGLTPPWPPEHQIENEAATFVKIWNES